MPSPGFNRLKLSRAARRELVAIAKWTFKEFGRAALLRYDALIVQALIEIDRDPLLPGSRELPESLGAGLRTYHIALSKSKVRGDRVDAPRHVIVYRALKDGRIEIINIIHEARDLARQLPGKL